MFSHYELSFLISNIETEKRNTILKNIEKEIKKLNGNVKEKLIEKKLFAYPVKKQKEGFLGVITLEMESSKIQELHRFLKSEGNILRFLLEKKRETSKKFKPLRERKEKTVAQTKKVKKEKVKIEELDKKLEEILK